MLALKARLSLAMESTALSQIASYLSKETEATMVNIAHNLLGAVRHLLMPSLGPATSRRLHCKPSLAAPLAGGGRRFQMGIPLTSTTRGTASGNG
jgi:hypothetical protein